MTEQKKTPSGGDRKGVRNSITLRKPNKSDAFPQEPLFWRMHCECVRRVQDDPNPVNRMIARIVVAQWRIVVGKEVFHG